MLIIYGVCSFILSSSAIMVGYVWIRDVKHTRLLAAMDTEQPESEIDHYADDIQEEYQHLLKKTA